MQHGSFRMRRGCPRLVLAALIAVMAAPLAGASSASPAAALAPPLSPFHFTPLSVVRLRSGGYRMYFSSAPAPSGGPFSPPDFVLSATSSNLLDWTSETESDLARDPAHQGTIP